MEVNESPNPPPSHGGGRKTFLSSHEKYYQTDKKRGSTHPDLTLLMTGVDLTAIYGMVMVSDRTKR